METTVAMADGDRLTHLGSEKGLAFFTAHPPFSNELLKHYGNCDFLESTENTAWSVISTFRNL